jgi:hypothetical protein
MPRNADPRLLVRRLGEGRTVAEAPLAVSAYVAQWDRAAGTIRRELGVLQAAINHAYKHGRLIRPALIELPPSPPARRTWLTRRYAAKLIRAARKIARHAFTAALYPDRPYTGRRKEAILSPRWPQRTRSQPLRVELVVRERPSKSHWYAEPGSQPTHRETGRGR